MLYSASKGKRLAIRSGQYLVAKDVHQHSGHSLPRGAPVACPVMTVPGALLPAEPAIITCCSELVLLS